MSRTEEKALGTRIDLAILKRLDAAAYALRLTKKTLVTDALCACLSKLEAKHNEGRPFRGRPKERKTDARVGKRRAGRVAPKPKARKKAGTNSASAAPARSRRRRAR